jgi:hypothetical protein
MSQGLFDRDVERRLRLLEAGDTPSTAPRGVLGITAIDGLFNTSAPHTTYQNEGLSVTASETAGRRQKWTVVVGGYAPGGANGMGWQLFRDGVSLRSWTVPTEAISTTNANDFSFTYVETVAATHANSVFTVQVAAISNNTQVSSFGAVGRRRLLIVEDIGV